MKNEIEVRVEIAKGIDWEIRNFKFHLPKSSERTRGKKFFVRLTKRQGEILKKRLAESPKSRFEHENSRIGSGWVKINYKAKKITWDTFNPMERLEKMPKRNGIGTLFHYAIVKNLATAFPRYTIEHDAQAITMPRQKQLARMGIDCRKHYAIEEYLQKTRRKIPASQLRIRMD